MDRPDGDLSGGVYVDVFAGALRLTTMEEQIWLDEEMFNNLVSYARRHLGWTAYAPTEPKEAGGADDE